MKFEIEDNLIVIDTGKGFTELVRAQDLEQILQAVKKTHEKLVNKQIQEIQDSKKNIKPIFYGGYLWDSS